MQEFDEAKDGGTEKFVVGERFRIRLVENRTTGFRWKTEQNISPLLQLVDDSYEPAGTQPGAGGVHTWNFQCTGQGRAKIEFGMSRSWETGSPVRHFSITAEISAP